MNEFTYSIAFMLIGSLFSTALFHALVVGYNWKMDKAVWVAPFAIVIVPFFFLIAFPIMMFAEIFKAVGNKFVAIGRK